MQLLIDGMTVTVIRKPIKNMNLRVLPPDGVSNYRACPASAGEYCALCARKAQLD